MDGNISRKEFLQKCALMGFAVVGTGSLIAGCGGGGDSSESGGTSHETTTKTASAADPCGDTTGLSETDLNMRTTLKYVVKSEDAAKNCKNCKFYLADQFGDACGGCQLFKGPVNPAGNCASWFANDQG